MCNFEQECLDEHNKCRSRHGCPPVVLNKDLCKYANEWAQHLASTNRFEHRSNLKYGENIFMSYGSVINGRNAVEKWYSEMKKYGYNGQDGFSSGCGHFTQVIWKNCKEIGVGFAQSGSSTYVVVNYDPPGNYTGKYLENVPPPK